jgi:hypothetical protein
MLAAGLAGHDPEEAYRIDLMTSQRERVQDNEVALSYVRSAFAYEAINESELITHYPAILNAVESLGEPPDTALRRIVDLIKRHGTSVATVMRDEMASTRMKKPPANILPALYGKAQREQLIVSVPATIEPMPETERVFVPIDITAHCSATCLGVPAGSGTSCKSASTRRVGWCLRWSGRHPTS